MIGKLVIVLLTAIVLSGSALFAQETPRKVALVIGNSRYEKETPLANPENDAQDIAEALARIGFDVTVKFNVDYITLRAALGDFTQKAERAEIAAVYYAGHGIELSGENYLIPVDATLENESQIRFQALELELVENAVSGASKLRIVFLDACRNNPFLRKIAERSGGKRSAVGRGLASVEPIAGTVVAFSAKGGTTASDGTGRNSPFAKALLKYIAEPGLDVDFLLRRVGEDVRKETNNEQEPFKYGSLPAESISLVDAVGADPKSATVTQPSPDAGAVSQSGQAAAESQAREAWEAVRSSDNRTDMETIVRLFPGTVYSSLAEARLVSIGQKEEQQRATAEAQQQQQGQEVASLDTDNAQTTASRVTMPQEPPRWFMALYQDLDFFGGDINGTGVRTETVEQCAATCGGNFACRMFTYNSQAHRCFLKNGYDTAQRVEGVTGGFFFKGQKEDPLPIFNAQWELLLSADLGATDLGFTDDHDYASCFQSCRNNSICTGLSYVGKVKRKRCWLKTGGTDNALGRNGVTSARRKDQQISPFIVVPVNAKD